MKRKKQSKDSSERWLLTYSDLITLLVAVFVILYAMSNVDTEKYARFAKSMNSSFGGVMDGGQSVLQSSEGILDGGETSIDNGGNGGTTATAQPTSEPSQPTTSAQATENPEQKAEQGLFLRLQTDVLDIINKSDIKDSVNVSLEDRGLVISFLDNVFFDSGKADIKDKMKTNVDKIVGVLKDIDNSICIEGHTDNVPMHNGLYSSNWQLSAIRAANVAQYIESQGQIKPERLSAIGYGEYKPVASNDSQSGRDKNRRVNIVVLYKVDKSK